MTLNAAQLDRDLAPQLASLIDHCERMADRPQTSYGDAQTLRRISFAAQRLRREITAAAQP